MKAPEEYLLASKEREAQRHGHATFSRIRLVGTDEQIKVLEASAIAALKAMQAEHEKELSKIKEGVEQIMRSVVAADPTLMDICLKIIREDIDKVLTQFRNKQQGI